MVKNDGHWFNQGSHNEVSVVKVALTQIPKLKNTQKKFVTSCALFDIYFGVT
jgi:hypothetical protein